MNIMQAVTVNESSVVTIWKPTVPRQLFLESISVKKEMAYVWSSASSDGYKVIIALENL